MYEYERSSGGLGWSDYLQSGQYVPCEHVVGGVKKCFTTAVEDRACAQNSGCFELLGERCTTTGGGSGGLWCCSRSLPPPPGNACVRQSTETVCSRYGSVRCADFSDNESYANCNIQRALCDIGLDPGPVDGTRRSNMFNAAIRMFKARNNISPVNEEVTQAVLNGLNLGSNARVVSGSASGPNRAGVVDQESTSYFWPVAFTLSSVFLTFSWWKYGRNGR